MKKLMVLCMAVLVGVSFNAFAITAYEEALLNNDIAKFEQQVNFLEVKVNYQDLLKLYLYDNSSVLTVDTLDYLIKKGGNISSIITKQGYDFLAIADIAYKIKTEEIFTFMMVKSNGFKNLELQFSYFNQVIFEMNTQRALDVYQVQLQYQSAIKNGINQAQLINKLMSEYQDNSIFTHYRHYLKFFTLITDHSTVVKEFIKENGNNQNALAEFLISVLSNKAYQSLELILSFDSSLTKVVYSVNYNASKEDNLLGMARYIEDLKAVNIIEKVMGLPLSTSI